MDAHAATYAYWSATYEDGNLADDPDAGHEDAGYERAEARLQAAADGVTWHDELDDWDDSVPF